MNQWRVKVHSNCTEEVARAMSISGHIPSLFHSNSTREDRHIRPDVIKERETKEKWEIQGWIITFIQCSSSSPIFWWVWVVSHRGWISIFSSILFVCSFEGLAWEIIQWETVGSSGSLLLTSTILHLLTFILSYFRDRVKGYVPRWNYCYTLN